jgi:ATP phosphoribosyltransferase
MSSPLTIALPKGRLLDNILERFQERDLQFRFKDRKLITESEDGSLRGFLVKNSDLPTYVHHNIAGLGICGEDVLYESGFNFFKLITFDFGRTKMSIAGVQSRASSTENKGEEWHPPTEITVATKFPAFTRDYFHTLGIPVHIIKLNGSVELAPLLGLAPYIVDLVETGNTLKANKLEIKKDLKPIDVYMIANPAYYKINYREINNLIERLR